MAEVSQPSKLWSGWRRIVKIELVDDEVDALKKDLERSDTVFARDLLRKMEGM